MALMERQIIVKFVDISFQFSSNLSLCSSFAGSINASFCPSVSGCREVVVADGRVALDFDKQPWQPPSISVIVPHRKTLILVSELCDKSSTVEITFTH